MITNYYYKRQIIIIIVIIIIITEMFFNKLVFALIKFLIKCSFKENNRKKGRYGKSLTET